MSALTEHAPTGHYRFRNVARMEWIKLRTLRSTWWALAVTAAGGAAMAIAIGLNTISRSADLTNNVLAGVVPGLLLIGVLGVLIMTTEYTSGMIRATLAAAPRRPLLLAGKAAVFGAASLVVGEAAAFLAFFAGGAAFRHGIAAPSLSQPGVLRAIVLGGASYCLIGLLGLGLGAIIRHTAAAIAVLVAGVFLIGLILGAAARGLAAYLPVFIIGNSLTTTKPPSCAGAAQCVHFLSPWTGLALLSLYAAVALAIGCWLFVRRDA
jgi:ABC-2 type transport system permease protein